MHQPLAATVLVVAFSRQREPSDRLHFDWGNAAAALGHFYRPANGRVNENGCDNWSLLQKHSIDLKGIPDFIATIVDLRQERRRNFELRAGGHCRPPPSAPDTSSRSLR